MSVSKDSQNKDCIANNIPSRAFRYATESKNVLSSAGAMYIGTGKTRTTTMTISNGSSVSSVSYDSYITAVLKCPQATGYLYTIHKVWLFETGVINSTVPALYDTSTSYTVGNIVLYDDTFYRCISGTSGDSDSDKWETIANHMFLPCWEKGADVWVPTLVDGVSIWEDINGDRYLYPPVVVSE